MRAGALPSCAMDLGGLCEEFQGGVGSSTSGTSCQRCTLVVTVFRAIRRARRTGKKEERNDRERNALKGHCAELDLDFKRGESLP